MTVTELREMLQTLENDGKGELEVKFSYNYGDYWRTEVAEDVSECEVGTVKYSEYHSMDKVQDDEEGEESRNVVLLK